MLPTAGGGGSGGGGGGGGRDQLLAMAMEEEEEEAESLLEILTRLPRPRNKIVYYKLSDWAGSVLEGTYAAPASYLLRVTEVANEGNGWGRLSGGWHERLVSLFIGVRKGHTCIVMHEQEERSGGDDDGKLQRRRRVVSAPESQVSRFSLGGGGGGGGLGHDEGVGGAQGGGAGAQGGGAGEPTAASADFGGGVGAAGRSITAVGGAAYAAAGPSGGGGGGVDGDEKVVEVANPDCRILGPVNGPNWLLYDVQRSLDAQARVFIGCRTHSHGRQTPSHDLMIGDHLRGASRGMQAALQGGKGRRGVLKIFAADRRQLTSVFRRLLLRECLTLPTLSLCAGRLLAARGVSAAGLDESRQTVAAPRSLLAARSSPICFSDRRRVS